jgi:hypothetical protein
MRCEKQTMLLSREAGNGNSQYAVESTEGRGWVWQKGRRERVRVRVRVRESDVTGECRHPIHLIVCAVDLWRERIDLGANTFNGILKLVVFGFKD